MGRLGAGNALTSSSTIVSVDTDIVSTNAGANCALQPQDNGQQQREANAHCSPARVLARGRLQRAETYDTRDQATPDSTRKDYESGWKTTSVR